jgi:hypothetical protein
MCLSNLSLIGQYSLDDVFNLVYIYSSQFSSMSSNRHAKQNAVIHGLKTRCILCETVKYPMCSYNSN